MSMSFDDSRVQGQIESALKVVKNVLTHSKKPKEATKVFHQYDDKFELADLISNVAIVAQFNCLAFLGVESFETLKLWNRNGTTVTLRFDATEKCTFLREEEKKEDTHATNVSTSGIFGNWSISAKEQRKVKYYYWKFELEYELFFYPGNNPKEKISLATKRGSCELVTVGSNATPHPEFHQVPPVDLNVTWLLSSVTDSNASRFTIDRTHAKCKTPRRNPEVNTAMEYYRRCFAWADSIERYFMNKIFPISPSNERDRPDFGSINVDSVFVPVIPVFEGAKKKKEIESATATTEATSTQAKPQSPVHLGCQVSNPLLMQVSDYNLFFQEQWKTHSAKQEELKKMFPLKDDKRFISFNDASLLAKIMLLKKTCVFYSDSLGYIENMLRTQLVAAIGKEVTPLDLTNYMLFHNRKLFRAEYEPIPFSYAVRLPDHYPEGIVGIDFQFSDGSISEPIQTTVRKTIARRPMKFNINAATTVQFYGERYLHAYVGHQFSKASGVSLKMVARARQFSCFILLLGRITAADGFDPQYATIVQNKDDLEIPLWLETIPTPKEFKERISSISPEQQRFAKAYRSLQLASTLFGVCVIQIKPQLEKLLKLPYDSLTKEIKMTQQLMELFIKYQIPSDLLSNDLENPNADSVEKLDTVRKYVESMREMIRTLRQEQIEKKRREVEFQRKQALMDANIKKQEIVLECKTTAYECDHDEELENCYSDDEDCEAVDKCEEECVFDGVAQIESVPECTTEAISTQPEPAPQPEAPQPVVAEPFAGVKTVEFQVTDSDPNKKLAIDTDSLPLSVAEPEEDVSLLPKVLNSKFKTLDVDSALRPTIINVGKEWRKRSYKTILSEVEDRVMSPEDLDAEKVKAYDLLDALSRSGCLAFDHASLHVLVASTHCFDKTLMDTVIEENVNPIEKIERSNLIVATAVHHREALDLIKPEQVDRVRTYSPVLFPAPKEDPTALISEKTTKKSRSKK